MANFLNLAKKKNQPIDIERSQPPIRINTNKTIIGNIVVKLLTSKVNRLS